MHLLFVWLIFGFFLLFLTYLYFRLEQTEPATPWHAREAYVPASAPECSMAIPQGYGFHLGHTWVLRDGGESARIGIDGFAANLLGKIEQVDVVGLNRWVRQGQRLMTLKSGEVAVDLLSPVEGVITAVNRSLAENPTLVSRDPYRDGWIAVVKSPDLAVCQKNLVPGPMVAPWIQNSITRLISMAAEGSSRLAQDGGLPVDGLLTRLRPELRQRVVKEFFLT
jgi:glycine cleavage system H lipoate-binding protein